jgi:hypothetical protein
VFQVRRRPYRPHQRPENISRPSLLKATLHSENLDCRSEIYIMRLLFNVVATAIFISSTLGNAVSLGHDSISNYAWSSPATECPGTKISSYDDGDLEKLCGPVFTVGSSEYRLSNCGQSDFQLQEFAHDDGWVFNSYCYPPDSGDLSLLCGGGTDPVAITQTYTCGVPPRRFGRHRQ